MLVDTEPLQDERVAEAEESQVRHELLVEAMEALNDREKHILTERRLTDEPKTLEELSQVYDVSRERIRQIEVRAFEKLQKALMSLAGERRLLPACVGLVAPAKAGALGEGPAVPDSSPGIPAFAGMTV